MSLCNFTYMATKTIAVDATVYRKLAGRKRESESFTKLLDRLADQQWLISARGRYHVGEKLEKAFELGTIHSNIDSSSGQITFWVYAGWIRLSR